MGTKDVKRNINKMVEWKTIVNWWGNIIPEYTHKYIKEYNIELVNGEMTSIALQELYEKIVYINPN